MKRIIITATLVACAAVVSAQTVTSVNIVGYSKVETVNGLVMIAQQFDGGSTPADLFGDTLPLGSRIYQFTTSGYNVSEYKSIFLSGDAWDTSLDLSAGSFWVETSMVTTNIFSGEVPLADSITNNLVPGLSLVAYPYPVEVGVDDLGLIPELGDRIYQFTTSGYNVSEYKSVFLSGDAWDTPLVFGVSDGFWYENSGEATNVWIAVKAF